MKRAELRSAMKRATLDQVLKLLDLAFSDYSEGEPSEEERQAYFVIQQSYENLCVSQEITGD